MNIVLNVLMNQIFDKINNVNVIIIIVVVSLLLIAGLVVLAIFNSKKKKCRKLLSVLRAKIQNVKQNDAIKNYSSYDNLKNDEKLGMLVVRWKKSIEVLVREIDAQYSMLDVLEDSIYTNRFKNFYALYSQVDKDVTDLEQRAEELNDEIAEYINKASDNRKYITKYNEMFNELVEQYHKTKSVYTDVEDKINHIIEEIKEEFRVCKKLIKDSKFDEADAVASNIFDDIKRLDHFLEQIPKFLKRLNETITPKSEELTQIKGEFTEEELNIIDSTFISLFNDNQQLKTDIYNQIKNLKLEHTQRDLDKLEEFLIKYDEILKNELSSKNYIIQNINYQKEYLKKIENTAKNFVSIFKVVSGSYSVSETEIKSIEEIIYEIDRIKEMMRKYEEQFEEKSTPFESIKVNLEQTYQELTKISKYLDENIKIIDEIYSDEKNAREKISHMTEKINGTKKFINYANLSTKERDLETIKQLNLKLTDIYVLLSDFPIDIVKLNQLIDEMINKVEKTTKDINNSLYKALLTEYSILYANRYYDNKEFAKDIIQAENAFYNNDFNLSYDRVMAFFDKVDPKIKRVILDKYQEKFNEIFN